MLLSLGHYWGTVGHFGIRTLQDMATGRRAVPPVPTFRPGENTMNVLETLSRAEAVIDLLRVNLAGDFGAALPSNAGLTLIEARQDSGVAACELVAHLIRDARRKIADRLAGEAADAMAKTPRESKPAAPPRRAARKTKAVPVRLHSVT
jgi:hypothetical protein